MCTRCYSLAEVLDVTTRCVIIAPKGYMVPAALLCARPNVVVTLDREDPRATLCATMAYDKKHVIRLAPRLHWPITPAVSYAVPIYKFETKRIIPLLSQCEAPRDLVPALVVWGHGTKALVVRPEDVWAALASTTTVAHTTTTSATTTEEDEYDGEADTSAGTGIGLDGRIGA